MLREGTILFSVNLVKLVNFYECLQVQRTLYLEGTLYNSSASFFFQ